MLNRLRSRICLTAALVAVAVGAGACGEHHGDALLAAAYPVAADAATPGEFPAAPPPFSPGVFPCSRCHEGGDAKEDTAPAQPHAFHATRGIGCEDCHAPEGGDPVVPSPEICWMCHDKEDLSENAAAFFARARTPDGTYAFVRRWKTRDVTPNHARHAEKGVECTSCHGELTDGPVTKPKPLTLMRRCLACHEERKVSTDCKTCHRETTEPMHAKIKLHHAEEQRGCLDCHSATDRDRLHRANGEKILFSESYKLCGQCHGPKLRDWKLGLHGKRLGHWDGRKEYLLCAHCHNPHSPRIEGMTPQPRPARPEEIR